MNSGIYKITNLVNGKFYIGRAQDLYLRECNHKSYLRAGTHHNSHLQAAWNKYGESAFKFETLFECPIDELEEVEQQLLDQYAATEQTYNISLSSLGDAPTHTEEQKAKWSRERKGKKQNPTSVKRMTETQKAKLGKPFMADGHYFRSLRECEDQLGVERSAAWGRLRSPNWPEWYYTEHDEPLFDLKEKYHNRRPVLIDNKEYHSISEAVRLTGTTHITIRRRCESSDWPNYQFA